MIVDVICFFCFSFSGSSPNHQFHGEKNFTFSNRLKPPPTLVFREKKTLWKFHLNSVFHLLILKIFHQPQKLYRFIEKQRSSTTLVSVASFLDFPFAYFLLNYTIFATVHVFFLPPTEFQDHFSLIIIVSYKFGFLGRFGIRI